LDCKEGFKEILTKETAIRKIRIKYPDLTEIWDECND